MDRLLDWKTTGGHKPLVIDGARQVGKTWLMKEFGKKYYKNVAYIDLEKDENAKAIFEGSLQPDRIISLLNIVTGIRIKPAKSLLIFDEIQASAGALNSLKAFRENAPEYDIISAGSSLGIALHQDETFPVGQVQQMKLHPLSYEEFLMAIGHDDLAGLIRSEANFASTAIFHDRLSELFKIYMFVGGMPEAVQAYKNTLDTVRVRQVQNDLLLSYSEDFSNHIDTELVPRVREVWDTLPAQLAKENKKFQYKTVKHNARSNRYEAVIQWLIDSSLIHKVNRVTKPGVPLTAYLPIEESSAFKLFIHDVGLLGALSNLSPLAILEGDKMYKEFKGALAEQVICQELQAYFPYSDLFYWVREKAQAEIDFLIQTSDYGVVPIEVKSSINTKAKSFNSYISQNKPKLAILFSGLKYKAIDEQQVVQYIPLYGVAFFNSLAMKRAAYNGFFPKDEDLYAFCEYLISGKFTMRETLAGIYDWNSAGVNWNAVHDNLLPVIEFNFKIVSRRRPAINYEDELYYHFKDCFDSVIGKIEDVALSEPNVLRQLEYKSQVKFGRDLLRLVESKEQVAVVSILGFISNNWLALGNYTKTFRMLADLMRLIDDWGEDMQHNRELVLILREASAEWKSM